MCQEWLESFEVFFADMGPRPSELYSIDRWPNKEGNYEPKNCRWATDEEQGNNMISNHHLTFGGLTMTLARWGRKVGLGEGVISKRLKRGWSVEKTLTFPNLARNPSFHFANKNSENSNHHC